MIGRFDHLPIKLTLRAIISDIFVRKYVNITKFDYLVIYFMFKLSDCLLFLSEFLLNLEFVRVKVNKGGQTCVMKNAFCLI